MYFFHEDAISRVCWVCTFVSSQAGSNLISLDHTANSPLDKHPHAIPGACLFCLAAFRLSYCQSMGHAEMKEMKLHTGFYVLLLRSCSLPEMPGFSAKLLIKNSLLLSQKNEPEETLHTVSGFQQGGGHYIKDNLLCKAICCS